jgi:aspartyl/asparaginyl-tRNA synthetase
MGGQRRNCALNSLLINFNLHVNMQDNIALAPQAAAFAATRNVNLSTNPKRMAIIKVWDAMFRGARKYVESEGFMAIHNMLHPVGVAGVCGKIDTLSDFDWYLDFHKEHDVKLHSGAGVGMARVAQFILGKKDIRACFPFLINRDNVI